MIGANLSGGRAVEALRQNGFEGPVTLIGEEPWLPYERPPLSKEVLWNGGKLPENFFLQEEAWYNDHLVDLRIGARAESIDLVGQQVLLNSGEAIAADRILLTTGARARRLPLPGGNAKNVHYLRSRDDADRLALDLRDGARIVIVGMGVIGAEVAASAVKLGCKVTAIEPLDAPMERALGKRFGHWLGEQHRIRGVETHFGRGVTEFDVLDSRVVRVGLDDGTKLPCDAVVVGIGVIPATELAAEAGIAVDNGIVVDRQGRTSHAAVFAAGDVAQQENFFGGRIRQETYQNAAEQGQAVALSMLDNPVDYCRPVWFWSDQYDLNIQFTGEIGSERDIVLRGDLEANQFSAFFLTGGVISGVLSVNRPADMGVGKRLVERKVQADAGALADPDVPMRELLKKKA